MAFRGRPDDVGLEPTAPRNEEEGTDHVDGADTRTLSAQEKTHEVGPFLHSLSYCTCLYAHFSFPAAPFLVLSLPLVAVVAEYALLCFCFVARFCSGLRFCFVVLYY